MLSILCHIIRQHLASWNTNGRFCLRSGNWTWNDWYIRPISGKFYVCWCMRHVTSYKTDIQKRELRRIGLVENLEIGERMYWVQYIEDVRYFVMLRETDTLYIIDLSKKRKLKASGELQMPGFSSSLHPIAQFRMLGAGQEDTNIWCITGSKVSRIIVSDKTNTVEQSIWMLRGIYNNAQWDHHAFRHWCWDGVAVMQVIVYIWPKCFTGAIVMNITGKKISDRASMRASKQQHPCFFLLTCWTLLQTKRLPLQSNFGSGPTVMALKLFLRSEVIFTEFNFFLPVPVKLQHFIT